jgi:predicted metal-dependent phosphoesterase TrpH
MTTMWPLSLIMRESYNTPRCAYRLAKARGMDLVAITDHDTISGALELAHLPDVIVGCEVSASFPGEQIDVHLGVLDITERQQGEIERRRHDVAQLLPYLSEEQIFTTINHVASQVNGRLTPAHIASMLPWIDGFEVINGSRLASQNRTAAALAEASGKAQIGGSDSHTNRGIGRT